MELSDTNKVFERLCLTVEKCALIWYVEGKRQGYRKLSFTKSKFFFERNSDFIDFLVNLPLLHNTIFILCYEEDGLFCVQISLSGYEQCSNKVQLIFIQLICTFLRINVTFLRINVRS